MADQYRLGKNGTKSARLCQFDQGDDQMNQEDGEVAHCGNRTKARQPVGFGPIREFAMDTKPPPGKASSVFLTGSNSSGEGELLSVRAASRAKIVRTIAREAT